MPDAIPGKPLTFEVEQEGDSAVLKCHGRLVAGTTAEFYEAAKAAIGGCKRLVVDLADLTYVDSSGLGILVRVYISARNQGCELRLLHLDKQVKNLLTMTNLLSVLAQAEDHNITVA